MIPFSQIAIGTFFSTEECPVNEKTGSSTYCNDYGIFTVDMDVEPITVEVVEASEILVGQEFYIFSTAYQALEIYVTDDKSSLNIKVSDHEVLYLEPHTPLRRIT